MALLLENIYEINQFGIDSSMTVIMKDLLNRAKSDCTIENQTSLFSLQICYKSWKSWLIFVPARVVSQQNKFPWSSRKHMYISNQIKCWLDGTFLIHRINSSMCHYRTNEKLLALSCCFPKKKWYYLYHNIFSIAIFIMFL